MARYASISDHGLIGDLQTAALVTTDGMVDWFCYPRFDSPSVFASLICYGSACGGLLAVIAHGLMPVITNGLPGLPSAACSSPVFLRGAESWRVGAGSRFGEADRAATPARRPNSAQRRQPQAPAPDSSPRHARRTEAGRLPWAGGRLRPLALGGLGGDACHGARPRRCDRA